MNSEKDHDFFLETLVRNALVPKGFRPESDEEIEQMLDAMGTIDVPSDKFTRVMSKITGDTPLNWEIDRAASQGETLSPESAEARELAEMFRAKGEDLPPELEEKLRKMEERAAEPPEDEDEENVD
ncbi:hypothetical protein [Bremerella sp.]|uniref:hypothetical protein n=1 Tax=Bremerella sp. TaxID=2795602 RepID=UPI00391DB567